MTYSWNNSNSSTNSKLNSRATPITGNTFDTSKSFNIIADENNGGNWSTEVNNETVSYSRANKIWQTSKIHYWPGSGSTVNFYAYYPTSILNNIIHTAGSAPTLSYTVPDDAASQTDILTAFSPDVSGSTCTSIPLTFKHIFAAVQFSVGSNGMPSGTITGVTLNNIQYKGTYSLDDTWTPNVTGKKSFSQTVSASTNAGTVITSGTTIFMMMPQTLGSDASITVTYSNGGTLTRDIAGIWEAGKTYTYNLSKTIPVANFDYTGDVQSYTVPLTGTYKIECWGAEGGYEFNVTAGGKGGYSVGYIQLSKGQNVYVCVGGSGNAVDGFGLWSKEGYNGGGKGMWCPSGGGATHIATTSMGTGTLNNYVNNRDEILIVAGGGGGSEWVLGGDGGGISGSPGSISSSNIPANVLQNNTLIAAAGGGKQDSGGSAGISSCFGKGCSGDFGQGGDSSPKDSIDGGGAGGGGWYGGGAITWIGGGGGGSGYIGGITDGQTIAGNSSMPSPAGGTETGHSGDGYARITFVSAN